MMKALICEKKGSPLAHFKIAEVERPVPADDEVVIRVKAAGLNPVDFKMAQIGFYVSHWPVVLGCDVSGVVEEVGPGVRRFKRGDDVYAFTPLGAGRTGAFAELCACPEAGVCAKPPALSFEEAAALPVGALTAALGIFEELGVPYPPAAGAAPRGQAFLVWGASGAVGSAAVQLAKLAGFRVVGVASARNEPKLRALGADAVIDRSDPHAEATIREAAGAPIRLAFDAVGPEARPAPRAPRLGRARRPGPARGRPGARADGGGRGAGDAGGDVGAGAGRAALGRLWGLVGPAAAGGALRPLPVHSVRGLEAVVGGLRLLLEGKVSGEKVVCTL
eukprot:tig00021127_g18746.t1